MNLNLNFVFVSCKKPRVFFSQTCKKQSTKKTDKKSQLHDFFYSVSETGFHII